MNMRPAHQRAPHRADGLRDLWSATALTVLAWAHVVALPRLIALQSQEVRLRGQGAAGISAVLDVTAPTALTFVLIALVIMPLALRRRLPLAVLGWVTVGSAAYQWLPQPATIASIAPLIALYTVGTLRPRKELWIAAALAVAFTVALAAPQMQSRRLIAETISITATFAFAASLGDATRNRRAYIAEVEQRASDAERTREEEARSRVEEERLRIARELHDITAHSLSLIAVQAGAAEKVVESNPAAAIEALEAIRLASKSSLDELRAMLGVLRGDDDAAPFAPAGTLSRLPELVHSVTAAGIEVTLDSADGLDEVPAFVDVSAYRIVQEALTNVVRHAGASHVTVSLAIDGTDLVLAVVDDGRGGTGSAGTTDGHGISGMRERVAALGGTFEAGAVPGGGFRVAARLPSSTGARGERE